jgi:hypothetical protein
VFAYADGWFKAGNEYSHENAVEEWFGMIGFLDLNDRYGTPRPVWDAFKRYNQAIIAEPKNGRIYPAEVPIELFTGDDVSSYTVTWNGGELANEVLSGRHHTGRLNLSVTDDIKDIELVFSFLGADHTILKTETITFLVSRGPVLVPSIDLQVTPSSLNPGTTHQVDLQVTANPLFKVVDNRIDIVAHTHVGFDPGLAQKRTMNFTGNQWSRRESFFIPAESRATTFGAGFTIQYGKFLTRIFQQKILMDGEWADPIAAHDLPSSARSQEEHPARYPGCVVLYHCYPNPFNPVTTLAYELGRPAKVTLAVFDGRGRRVRTVEAGFAQAGRHESRWDGRNDAGLSMPSGMYIFRLESDGMMLQRKAMLVR